MNWLIFFSWLVVFSWLITRVGFIRRSGLSAKLLIFLFLLKVIAGVVYFEFHSQPQYIYRSDTWKFYTASLGETELLKKDPVTFFSQLFTSSYEKNDLFTGENSYWNDVKDTVMIKMMAVTNLFTWNNYYANIIFFNFLFFIGLIAFYRLVKKLFPDKKFGLIAAIFFIPSFLFWCSGIHKDGLIFSCLGLVFYFFHSLLNNQQKLLSVLVMLIAVVIIFFLRNYLVMVLLVSLFGGWMFHLFPKQKFIVATSILVLGMCLFFAAKYIHPSLDLPQYIVNKQQEFRKLDGNTRVATTALQPNFKSFMTSFPSAIDMAFLRPHPTEKGVISIVASAEILLFWFVILFCIFYQRKNNGLQPVAWSCIFFSLMVLIIIGYTVPFSGAVVRYRSFILPVLMAIGIGNAAFKSNIIKKYI